MGPWNPHFEPTPRLFSSIFHEFLNYRGIVLFQKLYFKVSFHVLAVAVQGPAGQGLKPIICFLFICYFVDASILTNKVKKASN